MFFNSAEKFPTSFLSEFLRLKLLSPEMISGDARPPQNRASESSFDDPFNHSNETEALKQNGLNWTRDNFAIYNFAVAVVVAQVVEQWHSVRAGRV